jgi:predicted nucleic-acid-binding protein
MTGLDTNILVRFFTKDDPAQSKRAADFMRSLTPESPGFVSMVSLIELVWVLRSQYGLGKTELIQHMEQMLDAPELIVENHATVHQALRRFAGFKADFADCLIAACGHAKGCRETVTFDGKAAKNAGMKLL